MRVSVASKIGLGFASLVAVMTVSSLAVLSEGDLHQSNRRTDSWISLTCLFRNEHRPTVVKLNPLTTHLEHCYVIHSKFN
jgi:hypothetical protein